jgi:hypothetical protein
MIGREGLDGRLLIAGRSRLDVPAVVVAYDPGWPGLFRELRDRVMPCWLELRM